MGFHKVLYWQYCKCIIKKNLKVYFAWIAGSQFSSINKLEPLGKKKKKKVLINCLWLETLCHVSVQSKKMFGSFFWSRLFLSLLSHSVVFPAVLQCSAIWVGGSFSSASWASVHNTKTTLQSRPVETRSSAVLESIQKTIVIVRTKPLHFGSGFVPQRSIINTIF